MLFVFNLNCFLGLPNTSPSSPNPSAGAHAGSTKPLLFLTTALGLKLWKDVVLPVQLFLAHRSDVVIRANLVNIRPDLIYSRDQKVIHAVLKEVSDRSMKVLNYMWKLDDQLTNTNEVVTGDWQSTAVLISSTQSLKLYGLQNSQQTSENGLQHFQIYWFWLCVCVCD